MNWTFNGWMPNFYCAVTQENLSDKLNLGASMRSKPVFGVSNKVTAQILARKIEIMFIAELDMLLLNKPVNHNCTGQTSQAGLCLCYSQMPKTGFHV